MKRMRVVLKCPRCGSDKVVVEKIIEYESRDDLERKIIEETLCHDGFGWDLNTFSVKCGMCGEKIDKVTFEGVDDYE